MNALRKFPRLPLYAWYIHYYVSRRCKKFGGDWCHWLLLLGGCWMILSTSLLYAADTSTLDQVLALAEQRSASLRMTCSLQFAAEGDLHDARAPLWNNPEITLEHRHRQLFETGGPDVGVTDNGIGISQTFELGGQQAARRSSAQAALEDVEQTIEATRREVRAEAATRFMELLAVQTRIQVDEQALEVLRRGAELVEKRVIAGEDSRLDGNMAQVEAERAANQLAQAKEQLAQARSALATLLQLDIGEVQEATGDLDSTPVTYTLAQLLSRADRRPKLQALSARVEAARHRVDLAHGAIYPDLTVGLSYSPERGIGGQDRITTLSVSLPLPLFRRNAGGIGHAVTELDQALIARQIEEQSTHADVMTLWQRLQSLRHRVERLQKEVLPSLDENQKLSLTALQAGEIGLPQFLLVRRQLLDGQLELLEVRTELTQTRIILENTAGWPEDLGPLPSCISEDQP